MTQEFVTLPRGVVEQALEALINEGEFRKLIKPLIEKSIDSIREALEQPQNHVSDAGNMVPAGWKLVPIEPTDDMLYDIQEFSHILPPRGKRIWAHMLDAAPQPPTTEQSSAVQPQGEQEPVAWIEHEWSGSGLRHLHFERPAPTVRDEVVRPVWTPLYTHQQPKRERLPVGAELFIHPQNLRCKSNQARLATLWGYVKEQTKREPLIGEAECQCPYPKANPSTYNAWLDGWEAAERAHGIGGEA